MESWLANGFFLFVNNQQVQEFFPTFEAAQQAAEPYLSSKAELRIQSTNEPPPRPTRIWNYRYDIRTENKWIQHLQG